MKLKGNKFREGFGEVYRMQLQLFSSRLEEIINQAKPIDGRTQFVPMVFELGRRYPLFRETDIVLDLMKKYDAEDPKHPEHDFMNHQLEKFLYDTDSNGISVRLFNMDDGRSTLALNYNDGSWMVESFNFAVDKEDAPGLLKAIKKILHSSENKFFI